MAKKYKVTPTEGEQAHHHEIMNKLDVTAIRGHLGER
jgi:hypothetical protein